MAKQGTPTAVPRLRFPEFRGVEEWNLSPLGALAKLKNGYAFKSSTYAAGNFRIVTIANVQSGLLRVDGAKSIAALPQDIQAHQRLELGDILISMTGNVGRVCLVDSPGLLLNQRVGKLVAYAVNLNFFYQTLQREEFRESMQLKAAGGAQGNLSASDITGFAISNPPDEREQQKIADCLTSLDEVIAAQGQKVAALKTHKRGLMQQLFPREGETRPRLRFPEFRNAPEWEESSLDSCFSHVRNGFVGTATPFYVNDGGVPYLQGKNVKKGQIDSTGLIRITESFHERQKKSQLRTGDIVMVQSGHVGECAYIGDQYSEANCHALIIMTPKDHQHSPFFVHCFGSDYGKRLIFQITTGNTIKHILASDVKELLVCVPQFAEQKRIADCLSSLNAQITAEANQLAALKTHKQGLMQQLFPSPESAAI